MNQERTLAGFEAVAPEHASKTAQGLLQADRTTSYLLIILAAILGAYLYTMHSQSIFACPASGYDADEYLAYCHADHYGDYDHGAFWFGLEPGIRDNARRAEVLFLGNSRLQFGFSSSATDDWFAANATPYYLMGFAYWENYLFERQLVHQLKPQARVYIINIDTFFDNVETPPAQIVMHESDASTRYQTKHDWQRIHAQVCGTVPLFCGTDQAFFRSRRTGAYVLKAGRIHNVPVSYDESVNQKMVQDYTARAAPFLASLPVDGSCVLLTMVPTVKTQSGTARMIAQVLGATLIAPQLAGLNTFDQSHMDRPSAERWSKAFFEAAGPRIRQCLGAAATVDSKS